MFVIRGIGESKAIQPYSLQSNYWGDGNMIPDCPKGNMKKYEI